MAPQEDKSAQRPSLWDAILAVIAGLRTQPVLLLGFGLAIILSAAGALALEKLRLVAVALTIFFILALAGWILNQALAIRAGRLASPRLRAGRAVVGEKALLNEAKVRGGSVTLSEAPAPDQQITAGDALVGAGVKATKSEVKGGDVKTGR